MQEYTLRHTCTQKAISETETQPEWSIRKHRIAQVASSSPETINEAGRSHQGSVISSCPPTVTFILAGMRPMQYSLCCITLNFKECSCKIHLANRKYDALSADRLNASLIESSAFACRILQMMQNKEQHYPSPSLHRNTVISTRPYTM